jgi:deazaflavin-dependent oxidoreductase (nitroreductase family)
MSKESESRYIQTDTSLLNDEHVRRYQETDGEVGYEWNGVPILLLDHVGAKTGAKRTSALIFAVDQADYLIVASMGGAPRHPSWYHNLLAHPQTTIQVKDQRIPVTARIATEQEKPRLWDIVTRTWPNYDLYQSRTDRHIPVVVLSPSS